MTLGAAYYVETAGGERDGYNWVPESSRRARGFASRRRSARWAGPGVAELVERTSALARRMPARLDRAPGVEVLNDVVLNQVLVRFGTRRGTASPATHTDAVVAAVQADGTCWLGGTTLARPAGDAHLRLRLGDDRGRRRRVLAVSRVADQIRTA